MQKDLYTPKFFLSLLTFNSSKYMFMTLEPFLQKVIL